MLLIQKCIFIFLGTCSLGAVSLCFDVERQNVPTTDVTVRKALIGFCSDRTVRVACGASLKKRISNWVTLGACFGVYRYIDRFFSTESFFFKALIIPELITAGSLFGVREIRIMRQESAAEATEQEQLGRYCAGMVGRALIGTYVIGAMLKKDIAILPAVGFSLAVLGNMSVCFLAYKNLKNGCMNLFRASYEDRLALMRECAYRVPLFLMYWSVYKIFDSKEYPYTYLEGDPGYLYDVAKGEPMQLFSENRLRERLFETYPCVGSYIKYSEEQYPAWCMSFVINTALFNIYEYIMKKKTEYYLVRSKDLEFRKRQVSAQQCAQMVDYCLFWLLKYV